MRSNFRWTAVLGLVAALAITACADREATSQSNGQAQAETTPPASDAVQTAEDKPVRIAQGQPVDIEEHLAPGQITVFDFMSDYCGPCVRIAPYIDRLHAERADITVVKVDINRPEIRGIDWRSPVAQKYNMTSIPHFKIYGADGKLMAEGPAASVMLDQWLQQLVGNGG